MTPATRHVDVRTPSNGRPASSRPGIPAKPRIAGFTKMMYDMTMNVVTPAIVSVPSVVRFSRNRNCRSRRERWLRAPGSVMDTLLSRGVGSGTARW
jgi:hypothetical protein